MMQVNELIRPSCLNRRMRCPGSCNAEAGLEKQSSPAAEDGKEKHAAVAMGLMHPEKRTEILAALKDSVAVESVSMCWREADEYWDDLLEEDRRRAVVMVEAKISFTVGETEFSATPDFVVALKPTPVASGSITVWDWKFGYVPVPRTRYNPQVKTYLGVVAEHVGMDKVPDIRYEARIIKPVQNEKSDTAHFNAADVGNWRDQYADIIAACGKSDAPVIPGPWCDETFCGARDTCPARARVAAEIVALTSPADAFIALAPQSRGQFYERLKQAQKILKSYVERVEGLVTGGVPMPGYEVTPGRSTRVWNDKQSAIDTLRIMARKECVEDINVIEPISPAQADKLFKNADLSGLISTVCNTTVIKKVKK